MSHNLRALAASPTIPRPTSAPRLLWRPLSYSLSVSFLIKTFHEAFFGDRALLNKLRLLIFDIEVIKKFYPDQYCLNEYIKSIKEIIIKYNNSAVETIEMALKFMRNHDYDEILYYWNSLDYLTQQELTSQSKINKMVSKLDPIPLNNH